MTPKPNHPTQPQAQDAVETRYELTPAQVIFAMLEEATRRTDLNVGGEFGIANGNTMWHHYALEDRLDAYINRLLTSARLDSAIAELHVAWEFLKKAKLYDQDSAMKLSYHFKERLAQLQAERNKTRGG